MYYCVCVCTYVRTCLLSRLSIHTRSTQLQLLCMLHGLSYVRCSKTVKSALCVYIHCTLSLLDVNTATILVLCIVSMSYSYKFPLCMV